MCTARDVQQTREVVELRQRRMIVRLDLPIGWRDGVLPRKHIVANTKARGAHQQREVVLERVSRFFLS